MTRKMPAGFNKGQIEYIKTIANVNGHKTYKETFAGVSNSLTPLSSATTHDGLGAYQFWTIGKPPQVWSAGGADLTAALDTLRPHVRSIDVYDVPINTDPTTATVAQRVTPECFLESVHARMRMIQKLDVTTDSASHQEYRMCVFRHKEKQSHDKHLAENYANPLYDMFLSVSNQKMGPLGYRNWFKQQDNNDYVDWTGANNDIQSLITMMPNKEDYVWMKDCRFYLGKEYGGKHIFETSLHWDHKDPIATDQNDLSLTENNKNYVWYIALFATTNSNDATAEMPYVRFDCTTHVTSG